MKKFLSLTLLSSLILSSCGSPTVLPPIQKHYETSHTISGSLDDMTDLLSTVTGREVAELSFKVSGRITSILADEGEIVKKGQLLATLGNEEGNISLAGLSNISDRMDEVGASMGAIIPTIRSMKTSMEVLYGSRLKALDSVTAKATLGVETAKKDLKMAEDTLKYSDIVLSGAVATQAQQVEVATASYDMAQNLLTNTERSYSTQKTNTKDAGLVALSNAYTVAQSARNMLDEVLGVTSVNASKNDTYESELGNKNRTTYSTAVSSFESFNGRYLSVESWYKEIIIGTPYIVTEDVVNSGLERSLEVLKDLKTTLRDYRTMLENTASGVVITDSMLSTLKTNADSMITAVDQTLLNPYGGGIQGTLNSVTSLTSSYDLQIKQLKDALLVAEKNKKLAEAGKIISEADRQKNLSTLRGILEMKRDAVRVAEIGMDEIAENRQTLLAEQDTKLGELDSKISEVLANQSSTRAQQAETQMNRDLARNTIESGKIVAPFTGKITKKYIDVGNVVGGGTPILTLVSTDTLILPIMIDLSSSPVKMGQSIAISSLSTGLSGTGTISLINTAKDARTGKNRVEITLSPSSDHRLPSIGDRLIAHLSQQDLEEGILVENEAIISKYSKPALMTITPDGRAKLVLIKVLKTGESFSLVKGVESGVEVITVGKDAIVDGEGVGGKKGAE